MSLSRPVAWLMFAGASFIWGMATVQLRVAPYQQVRAVKNLLDGDDGSRDPRLYVGSPEAVTVGLGDLVWGTKASVAMVGDSITAAGRWQEMFPDTNIVNRGIGGDTVRGVKERLIAIQDVKPNKVFLLIGTNDILFDNPVDEIVQHYSDIIHELNEAGSQVYVQSILQCGKIEQCTPARRGRITKINQRLSALAKSGDATYIDLNVHFADADGLRAEFTWDGLHLNGAGYMRWRDALLPYVNEQESR